MGAAEASGVGCLVHRPNRLFYGNEVEKRNLTLRLAAPFLEEGDWIIVFDADCHVFKCDPDRVRGKLENTDVLLASYTFLDAEMARIVKHDDYNTESTSRTKDIYRWHPSLMYGPQHWIVSRVFQDEVGLPVRRWVRHSEDGVDASLDLNADLVVYHRSKDRAMVRRQAQAGYYSARSLHGVEELFNGGPVVNGLPAGVIS
jgi:hypothetical protein